MRLFSLGIEKISIIREIMDQYQLRVSENSRHGETKSLLKRCLFMLRGEDIEQGRMSKAEFSNGNLQAVRAQEKEGQRKR